MSLLLDYLTSKIFLLAPSFETKFSRKEGNRRVEKRGVDFGVR